MPAVTRKQQRVPPDKLAHMNAILELLGKLSEKFEPGDNEMKLWMMKNFPNPQITDLLQEATITTLKVLDAIGTLEPVNTITISREFNIPKGSVSKSTRRLLAQKLIKSEAVPNNKKEILFRTTPLGKDLFQAHRAFDQAMETGFMRFLQRYTVEELSLFVRVLEDANEASWLSLAAQQ